ncbi:MAG: hypothetical protein Q8933_09285 [Bacteroidota bacterium]|nr:hypothetical protein [Bacteroidota bacterium]
MNQFIQLSDDIIMTDLNGQDILVAKMYCNITVNKVCGIQIDIQNEQIFQNHFDECKTKIQEFKAAAEQKATENGIPLI